MTCSFGFTIHFMYAKGTLTRGVINVFCIVTWSLNDLMGVLDMKNETLAKD